MSEDDLATARAMIDAWNQGNVSRLIDFWHADGVWEDLPTIPDAAVVRGRAAIEEHLEDTIGLLGVLRIRADEFSKLGNEILISGVVEIKGAQSGIETETPWVGLVRFEDGLVRQYRNFLSREEAIAAAAAD
jgi:ketosteroid isomerase-like protein